MRNVIKSELYKTCHRPYLYALLGICCVLAFGVVFVIYLNSGGPSRIHYEDICRLLLAALSFGVYFSLLPGDVVFSDEYKHQTMKNTLSFGISRTSLYLGKLLTSIAVFLFAVALMTGIFLGSAYCLLGAGDPALAREVTVRVLLSMVCALPLWIGALCVLNMMSFQFKSSNIMSFIFVGAFALMSLLTLLMGHFISPVFNSLYSWMVMPQFDAIKGAASIGGPLLIKCALVGLGYSAVSTAIGLLLFRRREIK